MADLWRAAGSLTAFAAVAACASLPASPARKIVDRKACNAPAVRALIGEPATRELAARAMALTGATIFQWIPPDVIVGAAYSPYRVRVAHDAALRVTAIDCG